MGDRKRFSHQSKEDQTQQISKFVFVTNFPDHIRARDLWNICKEYGSVVDVYIPFKRSKSGKRFAFIRFIKVSNLERLIENLCTIWIGSHHLYANMVRFQREQKQKTFTPKINVNSGKHRRQIPDAMSSGNTNGSFASIFKGGIQNQSFPDQSKPALVLDDSCLKERDFCFSLIGQVKEVSEIPNLYIILSNEGFDSAKLTYLGGLWVLFEFDSLAFMAKFRNHVGTGSWFSTIKAACNSFASDERIVWISIEGLPINTWSTNTFSKVASKWGDLVVWEESEENSLSCKHLCLKTKIGEIINECFKIIVKGKVFWIRAKELDAWIPKFRSINDDSSSDNSSNSSVPDEEGRKIGDYEFETPKGDFEVEKVLESSCMHEDDYVQESVSNNNCKETPHSTDPFGIYEILERKKVNSPQPNDSGPTHPPRFTLVIHNQNKGEDIDSLKDKEKSCPSNKSFTRQNVEALSQRTNSIPTAGGSILDVMDNLVQIGQTIGYNMDGPWSKGKEGALWGNLTFDHAASPSVGNSGGILCVWDRNLFIKEHVSSSDYFLAIMGTWTPSSTKLLVISVYAPQELTEKRDLWDYLCSLIDRWDGETVILGDFNEVRTNHERFGSSFNIQGANAFNSFISMAGLIDLPLGGYSYTWAHKSASKMSKLDRFLIYEGLLVLFPHLTGLCLDRHLSDHRPIIMYESNMDYGPTPFRLYHSWLNMDGFDKFVEDTWRSMNIKDLNGLIRGNAEVLNHRASLMNDLNDIKSIDVMDLSQKAKVRWSIEGDENSKYFHGTLNCKRSQLFIRGILSEGDWIVDPKRVKFEFYNHFANQFSKSKSPRVNLEFQFSNRLNSEQAEDLERPISYDEIEKAVWDCGKNKSPVTDGFMFEFLRKYWNIVDQDIVEVVLEFFASSTFPPGCNSAFIALIPKTHDAKNVKDFRPVSLIGSIYKIITKILANRLSFVMYVLVSDVQTAFLSNRRILDGPFILNDLPSWCKHKKIKAMIFKVDFEKAFDSIRWDYFDNVLKSFGFGDKWRSWIFGCLVSAMDSVLINGSPTSEFQFQKGLKQGDPLSMFLFILVMESLHLSFSRVMEVGLFKGIIINNSLTISHLFYADDAFFVGKWNITNIKTIVNVLNCFFMASGLKINLLKSKLTGIGVSKEDIDSAVSIVGCSTFSPPFHYLGVKVGASMSRLNSWKEITAKVSSRLSKWKLKTLSIGGRLTLLKSVLTAIPVYHMSLFKVPAGIIKNMESIRMNFFHGIDKSERKMVWIGWDNILASKKYGGLRISSFYAANRALLFKWMWRFLTQEPSLWSRFIKAIHGSKGAMDFS
ncbi:RNA-directed DNA polymerase, eukaryota [Tanacetum coccineum]|uniref:RNA-directed DNA polymerase, eukaryota n=1 Tax=Tanacetum coccineum TaxID=301880 RepID=A0ABQ5GR59_9ASTR